MLNFLAVSFVSFLTKHSILTTFQVVHLEELVFCAASCSQGDSLVKVKGTWNEVELAVSSGGSCIIAAVW